jgi:hypothetical protein
MQRLRFSELDLKYCYRFKPEGHTFESQQCHWHNPSGQHKIWGNSIDVTETFQQGNCSGFLKTLLFAFT